MARVWIADHLALRTRIVVKFLAAELMHDPRTVARFCREAAAASQVKSAHVVQMLDHGVTSDGRPFITMELLEGCDLRDALTTRGPLSLHEVVMIVRQVAKALAKAHSRRIVHRDIKPENIFLCDTSDDGENSHGGVTDDEPFVKLLDFGIAKGGEHIAVADHELTQTGTLVGTPDFMSPEQMLGGEVDARTDLFALGVVAFVALTATAPFTGNTVAELALSLHRGPTSRPSEYNSLVPPAVDEWFLRACAREPADRFQSARELADALAEAAGEAREPSGARRWPTPASVSITPGAPVTPTTHPPVAISSVESNAPDSRIPEFRPRNARRFALGAAAALAVVVVIALLTRSQKATDPVSSRAAEPPSVAAPIVVDAKVAAAAAATQSTALPAPTAPTAPSTLRPSATKPSSSAPKPGKPNKIVPLKRGSSRPARAS